RSQVVVYGRDAWDQIKRLFSDYDKVVLMSWPSKTRRFAAIERSYRFGSLAALQDCFLQFGSSKSLTIVDAYNFSITKKSNETVSIRQYTDHYLRLLKANKTLKSDARHRRHPIPKQSNGIRRRI